MKAFHGLITMMLCCYGSTTIITIFNIFAKPQGNLWNQAMHLLISHVSDDFEHDLNKCHGCALDVVVMAPSDDDPELDVFRCMEAHCKQTNSATRWDEKKCHSLHAR